MVKRRKWMVKILGILEKHFGKINFNLNDPFKLLVATILSQHTSDKNSIKAFKSLEEKIGVKPEILAEKSVKEIGLAIRFAGLWKVKARRIKELSKIVLKKFNGDLLSLKNLPFKKVRELLLKLPGVGEKTADVFLVFALDKPVFPVDTHLFTLANRLKISGSKNYNNVKTAYEKLIPPGLRGKAHLLLLQLGKSYCTARKPKCDVCPISRLCPHLEKI
ncbi:MAG: endonuclease III [Candidatus Bathyarchaeota archaeon]|nr:endonuclease III [Candidatus Bathyarchaeota archaeon]